MTNEERIAELEAQLAQYRDDSKLTIKLGNKKNVVVGGKGLGQRFPVSLYAPSWLKLLDEADRIREFIECNREDLDWGK